VNHVVQETTVGITGGEFGAAAYLSGIFYMAPAAAANQAYSIANGAFQLIPTSKTPDTFSYPGSTPVISANGFTNRIVWDLDRATNQLRAYDARNLAVELYTSDWAPNGRDRLGPPAKFSVPIVANGLVYAATLNGTIVGCGLLHTATGARQGAAAASLSPATLAVIGPGVSLSLPEERGSFSTSPGLAANANRSGGASPGNAPNDANPSSQGADHSVTPRLDRRDTSAIGESEIGGNPALLSGASDLANDVIESGRCTFGACPGTATLKCRRANRLH
jgi:hypothetical protein